MHQISEWNKLDLKGKTSGKTQTVCPECSESRKKKHEKCVSINISEGFAKCNHCETLFFKDNNSNNAVLRHNYSLPIQEFQNYTKLSENLVKWFKNRGISQNTLIENNITEEISFFPSVGKELNSVCFNYFEGALLVDKKFRSGKKDFFGAKNAKKIFFNINNIIGQSEVYITEGEICCLSLYEIGIKNAISLPNGANDNDTVWINCEKYLKDVKKFYIATDNDEPGNLIAEKIAQRLGRYRCERVLFEGKDVNEDLVNGVLKDSILNTYKYPVAGTYDVNDLWQSMLDTINEGPPLVLFPKAEWAIDLNKIFGVMESQLTLGTGIPSHGKSYFTDWYLLNISNDYDKKISWFSPEHGENKRYMIKLASKAIGKSFYKCTASEQNEFKEWADERIYLTSAELGQHPTWDWIFETFKEQLFRYGVNIFVVDAFNKLELQRGEERKGINNVLMRLSAFCIQYNVNVFLVAHPTKMQQYDNGLYKVPDLYSVSGSADFRNQTHNGFSVYRYFEEGQERTEFHNLKVKDTEYQGNIGSKVEFSFNPKNGRFYRYGGMEDNQPLWNKRVERNPDPIIENIPLEKLNAVFDFTSNYNDELPF